MPICQEVEASLWYGGPLYPVPCTFVACWDIGSYKVEGKWKRFLPLHSSDLLAGGGALSKPQFG